MHRGSIRPATAGGNLRGSRASSATAQATNSAADRKQERYAAGRGLGFPSLEDEGVSEGSIFLPPSMPNMDDGLRPILDKQARRALEFAVTTQRALASVAIPEGADARNRFIKRVLRFLWDGLKQLRDGDAVFAREVVLLMRTLYNQALTQEHKKFREQLAFQKDKASESLEAARAAASTANSEAIVVAEQKHLQAQKELEASFNSRLEHAMHDAIAHAERDAELHKMRADAAEAETKAKNRQISNLKREIDKLQQLLDSTLEHISQDNERAEKSGVSFNGVRSAISAISRARGLTKIKPAVGQPNAPKAPPSVGLQCSIGDEIHNQAMSSLQQQLQQYKGDFMVADAKLSSAVQDKAALEASLRTASEKLEDLSLQLSKQVQSLNSDAETLRTRCNSLEAELAQSQSAKDGLAQDLESKVFRLQEEKDEAVSRTRHLEIEMNDLQISLQKTKEENGSLQADKLSLQNAIKKQATQPKQPAVATADPNSPPAPSSPVNQSAFENQTVQTDTVLNKEREVQTDPMQLIEPLDSPSNLPKVTPSSEKDSQLLPSHALDEQAPPILPAIEVHAVGTQTIGSPAAVPVAAAPVESAETRRTALGKALQQVDMLSTKLSRSERAASLLSRQLEACQKDLAHATENLVTERSQRQELEEMCAQRMAWLELSRWIVEDDPNHACGRGHACLLCFRNPVSKVVFPCGHSAICTQCKVMHGLQSCNICGQSEDYIKAKELHQKAMVHADSHPTVDPSRLGNMPNVPTAVDDYLSEMSKPWLKAENGILVLSAFADKEKRQALAKSQGQAEPGVSNSGAMVERPAAVIKTASASRGSARGSAVNKARTSQSAVSAEGNGITVIAGHSGGFSKRPSSAVPLSSRLRPRSSQGRAPLPQQSTMGVQSVHIGNTTSAGIRPLSAPLHRPK